MTKTPHEMITGEKPDVKRLRSFGCACYARAPNHLRHKLSDKARRSVFVGYGSDLGQAGWRVLDVKTRRIYVSRDESLFPARKAKDQATNETCWPSRLLRARNGQLHQTGEWVKTRTWMI